MISFRTFRAIALSLPEAEESPHFEKTSFRIRKKIFATYDAKKDRATLKLSEIDQDVFSAADRSVIYPVPNKWGRQGWTFVELSSTCRSVQGCRHYSQLHRRPETPGR